MKAIFKKYWAFIAIPAYLIAVSLVIWCLFDWLTIEDNSAHFRNIGLIVIALVGAPLAIWRTLIASQNIVINDRKSIADTFTKAIEQLGATSGDQPNIEVRLGAIYSLEELSKINIRYFNPIMEILAGYVRQNAPLILEENSIPDNVRIDVQAVLTVLCRSERDLNCASDILLDLSNTCLRGAIFHFGNLPGVNFSGSDLKRADFSICRLFRTNFEYANLAEAQFQMAGIIATNFFRANAEEASFKSAILQNSEMIETNLSNAQMQETDLRNVEFTRADLSGACLEGADALGASFFDANLNSTMLWDVKNLNCIDLKLANNWKLASIDEDLAWGEEMPRE